MHNKIVATGFAAMLSLSLGLVACGGNAASSAATSTATSEATSAATSEATSAATSEATSAAATTTAATSATGAIDDTLPVWWEGTADDGCEVMYVENQDTGEAAIIAVDMAKETYLVADGIPVLENNVFTLNNSETGEPVKITLISADQSGMTIEIEGHGKVTLKGVTKADLEQSMTESLEYLGQKAEKFLNEIAADAEAASSAASTTETTSATSAA